MTPAPRRPPAVRVLGLARDRENAAGRALLLPAGGEGFRATGPAEAILLAHLSHLIREQPRKGVASLVRDLRDRFDIDARPGTVGRLVDRLRLLMFSPPPAPRKIYRRRPLVRGIWRDRQ